MGVGDNSRSRGEAGLDPNQYQVLLIVEERMNEKFERQYEKIEKNMIKAVTTAVEPIREQLTGMERRIEKRFDEGNEKFKENDKRLSDHSDHLEANSREIREAKALIEQRHKDCPLDSKGTGALTKKEKKEPLFTRKDLLTLILTVLSPILTLWVLVQVKLIAFADTSSNSPVVQAPPNPSSTTTPP